MKGATRMQNEQKTMRMIGTNPMSKSLKPEEKTYSGRKRAEKEQE